MLAHDKQVIRDLLHQMKTCWDHGDALGYAALFTADSDYVAFNGERLKGQESNAELHRVLFKSIMQGSVMKWVGIESIAFLSPDIALVHSQGGIQMRWQKDLSKRRLSIQTMVAIRQGEEWKIRSFQNTRIQPLNAFQKLMMKIFS